MKSTLFISLNSEYSLKNEKFSELLKVIETDKFSSISIASDLYPKQEQNTDSFERIIALFKVIAKSPVKFITLCIVIRNNLDKVCEIVKTLATSNHLESLMLENCIIRGEDFVNILDVVSSSKLKSLRSFGSAKTPFQPSAPNFLDLDKSINSLSKLTKLTSLEHLSLSKIRRDIFQKYLPEITETILKCPNLNSIDFSGNGLFYRSNSDLVLNHLKPLMSKIKKFNMSSNSLGKNAINFVKMIKGSKLEELNISRNYLNVLEPQNLSLFLQDIFSNKALKVLDISHNYLEDRHLPSFTNSVKTFRLEKFYFAKHYFFQDSKKFFDFCKALSEAPNLRFVSLAKVFFTSKFTAKEISKSLDILCQSQTLNAIDLSHNLSAHVSYTSYNNDNFFNSITDLAKLLSNSNVNSLIFRKNFQNINDSLVKFLKTTLQSKTINYLDITPVSCCNIANKEKIDSQKAIKEMDQFLESKQRENICLVEGYIRSADKDAGADLFKRTPHEIVQIIGEYGHCEVVFDQLYSVESN